MINIKNIFKEKDWTDEFIEELEEYNINKNKMIELEQQIQKRRITMEGTYVYNKDMLVKNVNMDLRASYIFVNYETGKVIVTVGTPTFIDNMNEDIILKTYVFSEKPKYDIVKPYAFKEDGTGFYTYYCNIETDKDEISKIHMLISYREDNK